MRRSSSNHFGGFHQKTTENPPPRAITRPTLAQAMKRAFVIRLSPDTNPAKGKFQGHVEEVDTGRELKFRSVEEFLAFVQECIADGKDAG
jgi:hypothetical protein